MVFAQQCVEMPIHGGRVLLDLPDWLTVREYAWHVSTEGYATHWVDLGRHGDGRRRGTTTLMHRMIMGLVPGDGRTIDHVNHEKLDNRRANLRACSIGENLQNKSASRGGTSRFRGVSWSRSRGKWYASARVHGRSYNLGYYDDEIEAARAADAFRLERFPFAEPDPFLIALDDRRAA